MKVCRFLLCLSLLVPFALKAEQRAGAAMAADELRAQLDTLLENKEWAEAVLLEGGRRSFKVESVRGDTVAVREVFGPLQERLATYAMADFHSLRHLGSQRIPLQRALYSPGKSMTCAMVLEIFPGAGYFYIGQSRQGLALLGFSALVAGTAFYTGKDGAAGWVPLAAWIKLASYLHLRDEVRAMNNSRHQGLALNLTPGGPLGIMAGLVHYTF